METISEISNDKNNKNHDKLEKNRRKSTSQPVKDDALALQNSRLQEKMKKQARTHSLLVSIVVVFASSWFPLNLLNVVLDVFSFIYGEALLVRFFDTKLSNLSCFNQYDITSNIAYNIQFLHRKRRQAESALLFVI